MNALLIASLVLREASRRRLLLTVALLTLVIVALTGWGFEKLATATNHGRPVPHFAIMAVSSTLLIMMAFMFSVILSLGGAFLGALSTGSEIENGTLLAVIPRPITRAEIIAGKWLGNAILITMYAGLIAGSEFLVVRAATGYVPPHPFLAVAYLIAQALLVLTLTMCLSIRLSAIAAGFTTVVLFAIAWLGGVVGLIASVFHNDTVHQASLALSLAIPTDGLWRAAVFSLEPVAMAAMGAPTSQGVSNPFISAGPPTAAYLMWCLFWFACMFAATMRLFYSRDI
jgi:ABC-type transport system involved in multi-copper enzyme maturation permease subunit